jgi:four helix bundle protein
MQRFTELRIWQRSPQFALDIYRMTRSVPDEERLGIVRQIRRAGVSVPATSQTVRSVDHLQTTRGSSNIAEGPPAENESLPHLSRELALLDSSPAEALIRQAEELSQVVCE